MVDTPVLGAGAARRAGSSPVIRTKEYDGSLKTDANGSFQIKDGAISSFIDWFRWSFVNITFFRIIPCFVRFFRTKYCFY